MPSRQAEPTPPPSRRLPMIPLAAWAVALVGYPVLFLVRMAAFRPPASAEGGGRTATYLALALSALPDILMGGVLRLHVAFLALGVWAIAIGAGMSILRRGGCAELTTGERAVFGGGVGMGVLSLGTFLLASVGGVGIYSIGQRVSHIIFTYMTAIENVFSPQVYRRMFDLQDKGGEAIENILPPLPIFLSF